jgi:hypothetical protein
VLVVLVVLAVLVVLVALVALVALVELVTLPCHCSTQSSDASVEGRCSLKFIPLITLLSGVCAVFVEAGSLDLDISDLLSLVYVSEIERG